MLPTPGRQNLVRGLIFFRVASRRSIQSYPRPYQVPRHEQKNKFSSPRSTLREISHKFSPQYQFMLSNYLHTYNKVDRQDESDEKFSLERIFLRHLNNAHPKSDIFEPNSEYIMPNSDTFESLPRHLEQYELRPKIITDLKLTTHILLKEARKGFSSQNLVCSPLSLNFILNIVAMGSKGKTLEQVLSFIGSSSLEDVKKKSLEIMEVASDHSSSGGPNVFFANGVWVDQMYPLIASYKEVLSTTCKAEAKNVDMKQADNVVRDVNAWAAEKTKGFIQKILRPRFIKEDTAIILGNALYFKGVWSKQFKKRRTQHRDFYLLDGKTITVPFMTSNEDYHYGAFDGFKVLKIPYQTGSDTRRFSMYFFLPNENYGLQNLLEEVNSNPVLLHQCFLRLKEVKLDNFWIPKFKFSYTFEAQDAMQHLGLTLPFAIDCNDITEMVHTPPAYNIYFSKVVQKAVIEVDEKGTKAAAATFAGGVGCCPSKRFKRPDFIADHPFLFMIREETTGAIFSVGTVSNPLEE